MKNVIRLFILAFAFLGMSTVAEASHNAGGDIQYEYISSTGNSHKYKITMRLYRDATGINLPASATVYACSANFATVSATLSEVGTTGGSGVVAPTLFDCVSSTNAGVTINVMLYEGEITLPGNAPDWTFAFSTCCRNPAVDNITNPSSQGFYIEAKLNNQVGQNNSPEFVSEPVRAFCTGRTFNWKQSVVEPDGDSIYYRISHVKAGASGSCSPTNIPYATGWTYDQPITTSPANSLYMNPSTGLITFKPSAIEIDVMAVTVDEYRYDSTLYVWRKIGEVNRDMQIAIASACTPLAQAGVQLDYQAPGMYQDPVNGLPTVDYNCLDSSVTLKFAVKLDCSSISPDGTDFRLTKPDGQPLAIESITANCDNNFEASQMTVKLFKPLTKNGKYFLYSKVGNDGNTLLNKCGFPMNEFDTIQLNVEGCFNADYQLENVTIEDDKNPVIEWSADTSSYPNYLFQEWQIFRKDPGQTQWNKVGTVFNQYKYDFKDNQIGFIKVDQDSYDYRVDMKLNDDMQGPTGDAHSILLQRDNGIVPIVDPDTNAINLIWNTYNAWPVDSYTVVMQEKINGTWMQEFVHDHVSSPQNPVVAPDTTYEMFVELVPGEYRVCVRTTNPGDTVYTAYSNCLPIIVTTPPVPDTVVVPNFITPNADNVNDEFILQYVDDYEDLSQVTIYNRWGDRVWQSEPLYDNSNPWRGTNQNGTKLADGVYFYTIELRNDADQYDYTINGTVTIMDAR
ncbi:MAG: gliding motility-associated C-terminal domain-containing protein [Schleiferiaceae bacterium]